MSSFFKYIKSKHLLTVLPLFLLSVILLPFILLPKPKISFPEMTRQLFLDDITTDTLSLHYTLAYPDRYSIHSYPLTLPRYHEDSLKQSMCKIENSLFALSAMDTSKLNPEESYCYHLLKDYLALQKNGFSYTYLEDCFSPSSGIVANYPILMAEYAFRSKKDVTDYLSLLKDTPHYFHSFFQFQKERAKKGYFNASVSLEETIKQCETILTIEDLQKNSHFLQLTFSERLMPLVSQNIISEKDALAYMKKNNQILINIVYPAYENLKNNLLTLQTDYYGLEGLYRKNQGKEYYQWLVQKQIGCSLSVSEILNKLEKDYEKNLLELRNLQEKITTFDNYEKLISAPFPLQDRKEILDHLQSFSKENFPLFSGFTHNSIKTTIKSVSNCMEEYTSPAFYLIPPLDDSENNTIYINNSSTPEGLDLFTTLAHEGYPGHLYQTVYYQLYSKKKDVPLIRHIMNYGGYVEGWAIYCEFYSYDYATKLYPDNLQDFYSLWHKLLVCDKKLQLSILSILDIKLHYYNDSFETAEEILHSYGITDQEVIADIYQYILEEPGNYLKYYMGYLLLIELKEKAEILMDSAFSDLTFHKFVLNAGPSDFDNLENKLLKSCSSQNLRSFYSSSNMDSR